MFLDSLQHVLEREVRHQNEPQSSDHVIEDAADSESMIER